MLEYIDGLLAIVDRHPAAIRTIIGAVFALFAAGGAVVYRMRGSRLRKALHEWDGLFAELSGRVTSLYLELTQVREELDHTKTKLSSAVAAATTAETKSSEQEAEIQRLKRRVQELLARERELKREIQKLKNQQNGND